MINSIDERRMMASWVSPRKRYKVPQAINSRSIGSCTTSQTICKKFFFLVDGSSLYPSLARLCFTSLLESHLSFFTSFSVIFAIAKDYED
jgi:hypothetical protein